jgi:hypothetical protein
MLPYIGNSCKKSGFTTTYHIESRHQIEINLLNASIMVLRVTVSEIAHKCKFANEVSFKANRIISRFNSNIRYIFYNGFNRKSTVK